MIESKALWCAVSFGDWRRKQPFIAVAATYREVLVAAIQEIESDGHSKAYNMQALDRDPAFKVALEAYQKSGSGCDFDHTQFFSPDLLEDGEAVWKDGGGGGGVSFMKLEVIPGTQCLRSETYNDDWKKPL